jgi:hypothetical protein
MFLAEKVARHVLPLIGSSSATRSAEARLAEVRLRATPEGTNEGRETNGGYRKEGDELGEIPTDLKDLIANVIAIARLRWALFKIVILRSIGASLANSLTGLAPSTEQATGEQTAQKAVAVVAPGNHPIERSRNSPVASSYDVLLLVPPPSGASADHISPFLGRGTRWLASQPLRASQPLATALTSLGT